MFTCLDIESHAFEASLLIANFGYLVNLSAQTLSAIVLFIMSLQPDTSHLSHSGCCKKTWANALALFCIFGAPASMTIQQLFAGRKEPRVTGSMALRACSFLPDTSTLYFLLTPAVLLLAIQFIVISVALRRWCPGDGFGKSFKRQERLVVLLKTCIGELFVWSVALIARVTSSTTFWNIFTLCMALQSIFSTTVCILSRSVIGATLASRYKSSLEPPSYPNTFPHSTSDDDRYLGHMRQCKLSDDNERFYY
ncbi:unnamed protein product [Mesocestoides corti]|uniref:Uncharacterized protein n=1 Tax=Mesocestoides corti TaxID=53468 RepID=A0A0R3UGM1_MESCO|nr:unnamed protein product [Mesocestoides corti]